MIIQTELTRLTNAKAAIKAAIGGKGVDVPSGAKLDALAALVESIETGGGGGSVEPFTQVVTGTVTFAVNTTEFTLPEAENFLAAYFIRTDFWGVQDDIYDNGAQIALFASGQSFGYFSASNFGIASTKYQARDLISTASEPSLSNGKLIFSSTRPCFYGTYYYALLYGTK